MTEQIALADHKEPLISPERIEPIPVSAHGRMFSIDYLMQSAICTTLFYGYGFGWFGNLKRYQLFYVVAAIWLFQLIVSPLWLRIFRLGPMEWLWRSLTYWKWNRFCIGPLALNAT